MESAQLERTRGRKSGSVVKSNDFSGIFLKKLKPKGKKNESFDSSFLFKRISGNKPNSPNKKKISTAKMDTNLTGKLKKGQNSDEKYGNLHEKHVRPKSEMHKLPETSHEDAGTGKTLKKGSNPSIIERIVKKSLRKAQNQKANLAKEVKLNELLTEIRKNEIEYQNKQIRLQNSLKFKRKRPGKRLKSKHFTELSNLQTLKTDGSSKLKSLKDLSKKNNRSQSVECKASEHQMLSYLKKRRNQRKTPQNREKPNEASYSLQMQELENLLKTQENLKKSESSSSIIISRSFEHEKSDGLLDINRNISFICENESEPSLFPDDENADKIFAGKIFETDFKFTEGNDEDRKSTEVVYKISKSEEKPQYFPGFTMRKAISKPVFSISSPQSFSISPSFPKPTLSHSALTSLNITNSRPPRHFSVTPAESFSIYQVPRMLFIENDPHEALSILPVPKDSLSASPQFSMTLHPSKSSSHSRLLEQLSWNYSLSFLIEQMQIYEVTNFTDPDEGLLQRIRKKYSTIQSHLNTIFEISSSDLLESLSLEEHARFVQSTQRKKLALHKILIDSCEEDLQEVNILRVSSGQTDGQEPGEENDEDCQLGISHSRSLTHLHESEPAKPRGKVQDPSLKLSFGFENDLNKDCETQIQEIQCDESAAGPSLYEPRRFMAFDKIQEIVMDLFEKADTTKMMKELEEPLVRNPLKELDKLQELQIGTPTETEVFNFPEVFSINTVLDSVEKSETLEYAEFLHKKMLFHVINTLLQQFRPFGAKGFPLPWARIIKIYHKFYTPEEIRNKILSDLEVLNKFEIGSPIEILFPSKYLNEALTIKIKERQLDKALFFEAIVDEPKWIDYEFEETQVKLDLADMILQDLSEEVININS